jgi:hypothetical protein
MPLPLIDAHSLQYWPLYFGTNAVDTDTAQTDHYGVMPWTGTLVAGVFGYETAVTVAAAVLTVKVNNGGSAPTFTVPIGVQYANTVLAPSATLRLSAGDTIHLVSGGEATAGDCACTLIFKRD